MICLDSWIWLEYLFEDTTWKEAAEVIESANQPEQGGIVPATVIAEVSYHIRRQKDAETAEEAIIAIRSFDNIEIIPVTGDIAEYAAALRMKYYQRGECELSYADAIHLALAAVVSECDTFYSGDPDFEHVDEVDTVIL